MRLYPKHSLLPLGVEAVTSPIASSSCGMRAPLEPLDFPFPFGEPLPPESKRGFFVGLSPEGFGDSLSGFPIATGLGCKRDNTSLDCMHLSKQASMGRPADVALMPSRVCSPRITKSFLSACSSCFMVVRAKPGLGSSSLLCIIFSDHASISENFTKLACSSASARLVRAYFT